MKITHVNSYTHHHILTLAPSPEPFICGGCHQMGFGCSYTCPPCLFDLHKVCALPINPLHHPFQSCPMDFCYHSTPESRTCDACKRYIAGCGYSSNCETFNLHPSCANLPRKLERKNGAENGRVVLKLTDHISSKCLKCGDRNQNKFWSYASKCGNYCIHVPCIVQMIYDEWEKRYLRYHGNNVELSPLQITQFESSSNNNSLNMSSNNSKIIVSVLKLILTAFFESSDSAIKKEIKELARSMAANY